MESKKEIIQKLEHLINSTTDNIIELKYYYNPEGYCKNTELVEIIQVDVILIPGCCTYRVKERTLGVVDVSGLNGIDLCGNVLMADCLIF